MNVYWELFFASMQQQRLDWRNELIYLQLMHFFQMYNYA